MRTKPMRFDFTTRCRGIGIRPSKHQDRADQIYTVTLTELDLDDAGAVGKAVLQDVPEEVARRLADGLTVKRRYKLTIALEELEDPQREMFNEGAAAEAADTAETRA